MLGRSGPSRKSQRVSEGFLPPFGFLRVEGRSWHLN